MVNLLINQLGNMAVRNLYRKTGLSADRFDTYTDYPLVRSARKDHFKPKCFKEPSEQRQKLPVNQSHRETYPGLRFAWFFLLVS
ncbi:hypothetical protein ES703_97025 [subsurface metagenome]